MIYRYIDDFERIEGLNMQQVIDRLVHPRLQDDYTDIIDGYRDKLRSMEVAENWVEGTAIIIRIPDHGI